jgi:hypothetical protein
MAEDETDSAWACARHARLSANLRAPPPPAAAPSASPTAGGHPSAAPPHSKAVKMKVVPSNYRVARKSFGHFIWAGSRSWQRLYDSTEQLYIVFKLSAPGFCSFSLKPQLSVAYHREYCR